MLAKAEQLLQMHDLKARWQEKRDRLLADKIDLTQWMVDFIERFPEDLHDHLSGS
jgi:hypothetical protein